MQDDVGRLIEMCNDMLASGEVPALPVAAAQPAVKRYMDRAILEFTVRIHSKLLSSCVAVVWLFWSGRSADWSADCSMHNRLPRIT